MQTLWQDLRYGARTFFKNPGFTLVAVLTLALGIGANTAIFSVINAVLLRPLPFTEPDRLVTVWSLNLEDGDSMSATWPDFADWRAQNQSFDKLAAFSSRDLTLTGYGEAARVRGAMTSSDLFPMLGVSPIIGRTFNADEERAGALAAILGHGLWQRRFNSDPGIVGQPITINGESFTVVGVMPASFEFPIQSERAELWISAGIDAGGAGALQNQRGNHYIEVMGRLKPDATLAGAQAEMQSITERLAQQYPGTNTDFRARVVPYFERIIGDVDKALMILLGAVCCVLLIACANVANLLLARAATRGREMAVRAALGADRLRVVRQLLTESLLLALVGGLCGLLLAWWGTELLIASVPRGLPRASEAALDSTVLGFTLLVSMFTGLLFGLAPALHSSRTDLTTTLKDGGRNAGDGRSVGRMRSALIIAEVAVSFVLLVAAGLLINSFVRLSRVDPAFDPERILSFRINLPRTRYAQPEQVEGFYEQLLARVGALPGVTSASASSVLPLSGANSALGFAIEGAPAEPARPYPNSSNFRIVRPGYFQTMGIRLVAGRDFDARDQNRSTPVVIINESLARRYFPGENPLGKRINPSFGLDERGVLWREIIGVVKDVRHASLREESGAECYVAHTQAPANSIAIVARSAVDPKTLIAAVRSEVRTLDQDLPVYQVRTLEEMISASVAQPRFQTLLLGIFAAAALLLTAIGLYGVMAYSITQRTHEIGIRLALGAARGDVLRLVVGQGMKLAGAGLILGCAAGFGAAQFITSMLFGVSAYDPITFGGIAVLLACVAFAACYVPARRAMNVDPMIALRYE
ncbi:MAG: ABC transporter permease [Acidobacteria bacterium]|nr:ABC transporter permease [Acidobacteriota bacterium]